jgi:hypothetical protein
MVGDSRSMRVRSEIRPSRTGTFRSARSNTRLPATGASSRVLKLGLNLLAVQWG